jgi:hypothetical protein
MRSLHKGWKLYPVGEGEERDAALRRIQTEKESVSYSCSLPEQVHSILIRHGVIEDPVKKLDCSGVNWVSHRDWIYRCDFAPDENKFESLFLYCEGIDTVVDVFLNGNYVGSHKDMFFPLQIDISDYIDSKNDLILYFHSAWQYIEEYPMKREWKSLVPPRQTIRKGPHDFYNFNGPRPYLSPVGIFRDVCLIEIQGQNMSSFDLDFDVDYEEKTVRIPAKITINSCKPKDVLLIQIVDPEEKTVAEKEISLSEGDGSYETELFVDSIRLWWPIGFGPQAIYSIQAELRDKSNILHDKKCVSTGFRDLKMNEKFDLFINGKQVRMYGANLTALDNHTHVYDKERMNRLFDLAEECNFNILRAWGGGEPYPEEFYDEADARGILIWFDFFHRWDRYPNDDDFRSLCRKEAEWIVAALKHHPSICLWCGGNESYLGREVEEDTAAPFIGGEIFEEDYRNICARLDPGRLYIPNSPCWGEYSNDPLRGDTHGYTHIWFNRGARFPLFLSESCRVSIPNIHTMKKYLSNIDAPFWPEGFSSIRRHYDEIPIPDPWRLIVGDKALYERMAFLEHFYDAETPEDLIYAFGAAHGAYFRETVEAIRRGRPSSDPDGPRRSRGHMVWKYNDSWPLIFSGLIDYYLEKYIPFYVLKRCYQPVLLSFEKGDSIFLWLVNDSPEEIHGEVHFRLFDTARNRIKVKKVYSDIEASPDQSIIIGDLDFLHPFKRHFVLYAEFIDSEKGKAAEAYDFTATERRIRFPDAELSLEVSGDSIYIGTDVYAHSIELTGEADGDVFGWSFSDNYFNLLPGIRKKIQVSGRHSHGTISAKSHYSKHRTIIDWLRRHTD